MTSKRRQLTTAYLADLSFLPLVLSLLFPGLAAGTELTEVFGDEYFVSIVTGNRQLIAQAPAVTTVIPASAIKTMGATDINQVLETVPGMHVSLSSARLSSIYSLRGIQTNNNPHVLFMVNGVPITQVWMGDRGALFGMPVMSIARIEVMRSPASAIYGADAFAGVINVITKSSGDIPGTEIGSRAGTFDTREAWLLHGSKWRALNVELSLEWSDSGGDRNRIVNADGQTLLDQLVGTSASLAPGAVNTQQERLDTRLEIGSGPWLLRLWNWRQIDAGVGAGLAEALDPGGRLNANNYLGELLVDSKSRFPDWQLAAHLSYMDIDTKSRQKLFPAGTLLPVNAMGNLTDLTCLPGCGVTFVDGLIGNPAKSEQHYRFELAGYYNGFAGQRLRFAGGYYFTRFRSEETKNFASGSSPGIIVDVTGTPYVYAPNVSRRVVFLSAQDEWDLYKNVGLTAGVRFDRYSDFGNTINPRIALVWQAMPTLTGKLLFGRAFRAPSFHELYVQINPLRTGNPGLDPETMQSWELVFDYHPLFSFNLVASLFLYHIDDVTGFNISTLIAENSGELDGHGVEIEWNWNPDPHFTLRGNYAWQRSENGADLDPGNVPHQQIVVATDWQWQPHWQLSAQLEWLDARRRAPGDYRQDLQGYTIVDVSLRHRMTNVPLEIAAVIRNLFDKDVREPSLFGPPLGVAIPDDYPLPGRNIFGELRYMF